MINSFEINVNDECFEEPKLLVNEHLNQLGADYFVERADKVAMHNGTEYAFMGGDTDASLEAAIVMPAPFGNGAWPHILARGEAVHYLLAEAGLRDRYGNLVPVLVTASACKTSLPQLKDYQDDFIKSGNFGPLGNQPLDIMRKHEVGQIAGLYGYSEGGAQIAAIVRNGRDFDITGKAVIAATPNASKSSVGIQVVRFGREGMGFKKELKKEGVEVIDNLFDTKRADRDFVPGIIAHLGHNLLKLEGFGKGGLACDMVTLSQYGIDTTLIHASNDKIAPRKQVIKAFDRAAERIQDIYETRFTGDLTRVEVLGTNHTLGDRVGTAAAIVTKRLLVA